jgi:hypothetical protein
MNTLFSHIVQKRLSQEYENIATEGLDFVLHSSESARRYEDRVTWVSVEAGKPHLQFNLPSNVQVEHNPRNAKRKTVPAPGKSLSGSGENDQCILGPGDQDAQTDMLGKFAFTSKPRANGLSLTTELNQRTSFFAFPRMHRRFPKYSHREVRQLLNVYFGIELREVEPAFLVRVGGRAPHHNVVQGKRLLDCRKLWINPHLWMEQRGLCAVCNIKITRITGWRLHYCVPLVKGGSKSAENRVLLHPECHDRVHRQHLSVSKPRLPERGVRRA